MKKQLLVYTVAMMMALQGSAQTATFFNTWTTEYDGFGNGHGVIQGLSTNGKYAVGFGDNSQLSIMWSKESNTLTDIYSYDEETTDHAEALGYDVSDAGTVVGSFYALQNVDSYGRYKDLPGYRTIDGKWHNVELLLTDSTKLAGMGKAGKIIKISGDGTIMAGYIQSEDGSKSVPVLWDGEGKLIRPLIPAPECNFFNLTAMSEDGSVLAGFKMKSNFVSVFQTMEAAIYVNGQWTDVPFTDYPENAENHRSFVTSISENGAYACGYTSYSTSEETVSKGFIYNVSQKEFTFIDNIIPSVVTNNGTLYGRTHVDDIMAIAGPATAVLYKDNQLKNVKEWLISEYNLSETETADIVFSDITGVSEEKDGCFTLVGHTTYATGMHNAEKGCKPFVICIENNSAEEEYTTTELGTIADSKRVKVTYFDGVLTQAGAFYGISENNKYIVGTNGSSSYIYSREDATLRKLNSPEYEHNIDGNISTTRTCRGQNISNNGIVCGTYACKDSIIIEDGIETVCEIAGYYKNGQWYPLDRMDGVDLMAHLFDGAANAINSDGNIIAGHIPAGPYKYQACKWSIDGKIKTLLPGCESGAGGSALSMSDDGTVVCGWIGDSMYGYPAIWINDELVSLDETIQYIGSAKHVSRNGKYVVGMALSPQSESYSEAKGFVYDTQNKQVTFVPYHEGANGSAITGISEDGNTIIGYSMKGSGVLDRTPFIIIDGEFHDLDEYIKSLGWEAPTEYQALNFFTPGGISSDGKIIYGICDNDGMRLAYVIELKDEEPISKTIYGHVSYNDLGESGLASFSTIDPTDINIFAPTEFTIQAGTLAGENYYVVGEKASATPWVIGVDKPSFMKMDLATGETVTIGTLDALLCFDMTYDYTTGSMYAITSDDGELYSLATLNPTDATITKTVELDNTYITLACNFKGNLYSIDVNGNLYQLNKEDGSATLIGETGLVPCYGIMQTTEFDHDCDILYWVASTNDGNTSNFATVNTKTGKATVVNTFANNDNIVALCIPSDKVNAVDGPAINNTNVNMSSAVVTGNLYIRGEYTSAAVYTTTGTCVLNDNQATGSLDFSTLPTNIYIVKVVNGNQAKTFKVIKK